MNDGERKKYNKSSKWPEGRVGEDWQKEEKKE